jgi:hypothetical protein
MMLRFLFLYPFVCLWWKSVFGAYTRVSIFVVAIDRMCEGVCVV